MKSVRAASLLLIAILMGVRAAGQSLAVTEEDTFNRKKFIGLASAGAGIYGAAVIGLNAAWYKDNPRSSFHFFDDWGEWNHMDKLGHAYTAYFEAELCYKGARWTGMSNTGSTWTGMAAALIMQSTVEVLDGYSKEWGFSWTDMAFNFVGLGIFGAQQLHWHEQRIRLKVSSSLAAYDQAVIRSLSGQSSTTLDQRSRDLFGQGIAEQFLKDYNAQTIWLSANLTAFVPESAVPPWLNFAIGYGSKNLYGGFSNSWSIGNETYRLDSHTYPRQRQWYLSPDIDFARISTNSKLLRTIFTIANIFKIPAPALEFSGGKFSWRWLHL